MDNIEIIRFSYNHIKLVQGWLQTHGKSDNVTKIPQIGYVATSSDGPIAAGFLRDCDGVFGIIDGLVSNPKASSEARDQALDMITEKIIEQAKDMKLDGIVAWSNHKNTLLRASRHGFVATDHTFIVKKLD